MSKIFVFWMKLVTRDLPKILFGVAESTVPTPPKMKLKFL